MQLLLIDTLEIVLLCQPPNRLLLQLTCGAQCVATAICNCSRTGAGISLLEVSRNSLQPHSSHLAFGISHFAVFVLYCGCSLMNTKKLGKRCHTEGNYGIYVARLALRKFWEIDKDICGGTYSTWFPINTFSF